MDMNVEEYMDIESKYFTKVPYDTDDSDFNWHKMKIDSPEGEADDKTQIPQKPFKSSFGVSGLSLNDTTLPTSSQLLNEVMPMYRSFQLIGDGQFLRFSEHMLPYKSYASLFNTENATKRISYCVSGQTIEETEFCLRRKEYPIGKRIILLIGTNDFITNVSIEDMYRTYKSLVKFLHKNTKLLVLLTVPPIPELARHADHWIKLKRLNDMILSLAKDKKVLALDSASLFITYNNSVNLEFFEKNSNHINKIGFTFLKTLLDVYLTKYGLV
ncbi:hypothetical protein FQR65_LT00991 [Abscondita terminalis]|nr:hypothetical protein FQR65_LT00991 [Abscondita terminalis]